MSGSILAADFKCSLILAQFYHNRWSPEKSAIIACDSAMKNTFRIGLSAIL